MKLTQTVQKGGCAAKIAARELRQILSQVRFPKTHPELLVDGGLFDDAAIYQVTEDIALVQTLDFFTPIVDSPHTFGAIAAANALSDVYAMGGKPKTALAILAFPLAQFENKIISDILQAASDKIAEAGANFVGGHSIDDDTLKFGLSVTGYVHPKKIWSNNLARPQDHLILTKPLGTGTVTAALKRGEVSEEEISPVLKSMMQLNHVIDFLTDDEAQSIHAATDITGFGLAGHSLQMARASQVSLRIQTEKLPRFNQSLEFIEKGFLTKAHRTNQEYTEGEVNSLQISNLMRLLTVDPQTSGGLLLSVDSRFSQKLLEKIKKRFTQAEIIGSVETKNQLSSLTQSVETANKGAVSDKTKEKPAAVIFE